MSERKWPNFVNCNLHVKKLVKQAPSMYFLFVHAYIGAFLSSLFLSCNDVWLMVKVCPYIALLPFVSLSPPPQSIPSLRPHTPPLPPSRVGQTLFSAPVRDRAWNFPTRLLLTLHQSFIQCLRSRRFVSEAKTKTGNEAVVSRAIILLQNQSAVIVQFNLSYKVHINA